MVRHNKSKVMATKDLLRNKVAEIPTIYAYKHIGVPAHKGMLKVGYTTRDVENLGEDIPRAEFLDPDLRDSFPRSGFLHPKLGQTFPGSE